jgi:hypothetical protein
VADVVPIGVAGFVVMLACSLWAVTSYRRMTGNATAKAGRSGKMRRAARGRPPGRQARSGLMGRYEERWRHRQHRDH